MSRLEALRTAALPFVTRSLRGGRLRRTLALSLLLSLLTVILGAWISFGAGDFEHEVRVSLDLEERKWSREQNEYVIIVDDPQEAGEIRRDLERVRLDVAPERPYYSQAQSVADEGIATLRWAAQEADRGFQPDADAARGALHRAGISGEPPPENTLWQHFSWYNDDHARRARAIVAQNLIPRVEVYQSPLTLMDGVRLTGAIAGGVFSLLLLVFGPLLTGTQMAQEVHENTLQPLTGTSLRTRELLLGLTAGPLVPIALLAIPQALILLTTVAIAGHPIAALGALAVATVGCFFLSMLAQLAGYALGGRRSPGVLGMGLLFFFGLLALIGAGFGLFPSRSGLGILALLPEAATAHLLRSSLMPHELFLRDACAAHSADLSIAVGAAGIGILGVLGLRALERRVSRAQTAALSFGEALLGAAVTSLLIVLANPGRTHGYSGEAFHVLNLALVAVPFVAFLMMRVPIGDAPATTRNLPTTALLGELGLWAGILAVIAAALESGHHEVALLHPVALFYAGWYFVVLGLLAIRMAARPMGLAARIWVTFCGGFALIALPHVGQWMRPYRNHDLDDLVGLAHLSPFLGLVQVILMIAVPWALLRALRRPAKRA